jgi:hypothetical protein
MSHYLFQFFALLLTAILFSLWQRRNRSKPAPIRNGFQVVRWPLPLRLLYMALFIVVLAMCAVLFWERFATDENVPFPLLGLAMIVLALSSLGLFSWRVRTEYNDTILVAYAMTGKPRRFALSDFTRAGPISWRGTEFSTEAGEKVYVNSYQTGGPVLIDLLQQQVKETYFE